MRLIYENELGEWQAPFDPETLGLQVCEAALENIGCPFEAQVNLTIVDSEGIRRLNKEFRGIDAATDVLSFPLCELPAPGDFSELEAYADRMEAEENEPEADGSVPGSGREGPETPEDATDAGAEPDLGDCFDSDTGELLLGDIVINRDRVVSQAESYGHSLMREYAFLITHSMLHLMGYDHMETEEAAVMEGRQEEILQGLGISR